MDGIFGGNGQNGTVSVRGKDGQPLVELLGRDTEAAIGAGQTGRPGRISLFNEHGQEALRLQASPQTDITLNGQSLQNRLNALEIEIATLRSALTAHIDTFKKHSHFYNFAGVGLIPGSSEFYGFTNPVPDSNLVAVQPPGVWNL